MFLNGERVPVKTFQDYVNLYLGAGTQRVYEKLGDRWEVCISLAEQGQFQQATPLPTTCLKNYAFVELVLRAVSAQLCSNGKSSSRLHFQ